MDKQLLHLHEALGEVLLDAVSGSSLGNDSVAEQAAARVQHLCNGGCIGPAHSQSSMRDVATTCLWLLIRLVHLADVKHSAEVCPFTLYNAWCQFMRV